MPAHVSNVFSRGTDPQSAKDRLGVHLSKNPSNGEITRNHSFGGCLPTGARAPRSAGFTLVPRAFRGIADAG